MKKITQIAYIIFLFFISCTKDENSSPVTKDFVSAVDISQYPEIASSNISFKDFNGNQKDLLDLLKENGVNTIRLRLWVNPVDEHSGFEEVKQFSQVLKLKGFKTWLTVHYSDTWADPANQQMPSQWEGLSYTSLKDSVYNYTKKVVNQINPDYIQIGNEINSGFLHPIGKINNQDNFLDLIKTGCLAVRQNSSNCKIILHYAGIQNSDSFFSIVKYVDYDIIGLSYYPIWHGKSITQLKQKLQELGKNYNKSILIAETAYPFTLDWNDWTNNVVGQNSQLILPDYPATNEGQKKFIHDIKSIMKEAENGIGFCYWGAELIAWKGNQATNASPWENQAIFDFNNKALPVLSEFKNE
ncbi:glycosyl hydrolase 53 family protein [Flavobacterium sp.]|uniref:glycoside hydrolase family 53 protein n=1 Tax=Flavobacterium sp. TaxID=239 RepID=UPI0025BD9C4F|nr:glycosyl hydrolase 53 family protein [Flavobacterium sp.]